jgi:hypothetical protein
MKKRKQLSTAEAKRIGDSLYIDWNQVDLEQFRRGLIGNHERSSINPKTEIDGYHARRKYIKQEQIEL